MFWLLTTSGASLAVGCAGGDAENSAGLARADSLISAQQYSEALSEAQSVLKSNDRSPRANRLAGEGYLGLGQLAHAYNHLLIAQAAAPDRAETRLALARVYLKSGNLTAAREQAYTVLDADSLNPAASTLLGATPRTPAEYFEQEKGALATLATDASAGGTAARRLLAELALAEGNSTLAEEMLGPILQKDSADTDGLVQLGRARFRGEKLDEATALLRRAIVLEPSLAPARYHLGVALAERGNVAEAQAQLDTAITLTGNYPEAVTRLAALNVRADIARASIGDAERQVRLNPRSLESRRVLGELLIGARRADEADEVFRDAAKRMPDRPEPHYWLGESLFKQGKNAEARRELETALGMSPGLAEALSKLVAIDLSENRSDSALARVARQLQLVADSAALYDLLGVIRQARNEPEAAEAAFLNSVRLDPNLLDPHVQLANFYVARQKFDLAVAHGEHARKLDSRNLAGLIALGVAYQATGEVAKARQAYERALTVDPNSAAAANNLAYLLSETETNQADALRYALVALRVAPNDPHVNDTAGWILYKAGRYSQALALLQESARRLPGSPDIQYHFGMAAQAMGDTATARRALTLAVAATIDFPGKDNARKALAMLR